MYRIFEKLKSSEPPVSSTFMVSFAKGVGLLLNLLLYFKLDFPHFQISCASSLIEYLKCYLAIGRG